MGNLGSISTAVPPPLPPQSSRATPISQDISYQPRPCHLLAMGYIAASTVNLVSSLVLEPAPSLSRPPSPARSYPLPFFLFLYVSLPARLETSPLSIRYTIHTENIAHHTRWIPLAVYWRLHTPDPVPHISDPVPHVHWIPRPRYIVHTFEPTYTEPGIQNTEYGI
jgi:hypothetical protein